MNLAVLISVPSSPHYGCLPKLPPPPKWSNFIENTPPRPGTTQGFARWVRITRISDTISGHNSFFLSSFFSFFLFSFFFCLFLVFTFSPFLLFPFFHFVQLASSPLCLPSSFCPLFLKVHHSPSPLLYSLSFSFFFLIFLFRCCFIFTISSSHLFV